MQEEYYTLGGHAICTRNQVVLLLVQEEGLENWNKEGREEELIFVK